MDTVFSVLSELRRQDRPMLVVIPEPTPVRSVSLLAGSFDPLTVGHAAIAEAAADRSELVVFVYSARTLPKDDDAPPPLLGEEQRIESLLRYCESRGCAVGLCSHGLLADQVEAAARRFPDARLAMNVGSDKLLQVLDPSWYDDRDAALAELFGQAELRYAVRDGDEAAVADALARPENTLWAGRIVPLDVPGEIAAVSSRMVREMVRRGEDPSDLVPPEVRPFLRKA